MGTMLFLALTLMVVPWLLARHGAAAQAAPTVQTRTAGNLGTVLVSNDGKTLYVFDRDTPGTSACTGDCATTWPPLTLASGDPVAPPGVGGKFALITRSDGKRQVTYNDRPLYNFAADTQPGDTKGDGVGGIWHAAKPVAAAAAASAPASGSAAPSAGSTARVTAMPATGSGGQAGAAGRDPRLMAAFALGVAVLIAAGFSFARRAARSSDR
jgi:predicted lipoprotein with Yx(FWY)xxD motif